MSTPSPDQCAALYSRPSELHCAKSLPRVSSCHRYMAPRTRDLNNKVSWEQFSTYCTMIHFNIIFLLTLGLPRDVFPNNCIKVGVRHDGRTLRKCAPELIPSLIDLSPFHLF